MIILIDDSSLFISIDNVVQNAMYHVLGSKHLTSKSDKIIESVA